MTDFDPFADVDADEAQTAPAEPVKKATARKTTAARAVASLDEGKVVVTLKGGDSFDEPWIVGHAASVAEAAEMMRDPALVELMDLTQAAAKAFRDKSTATPKAAAPAARSNGQQGRPQGAAEAPAGSPACPDGWEFKSGFSQKTQKPWKGYFPPRGSAEKPIFF